MRCFRNQRFHLPTVLPQITTPVTFRSMIHLDSMIFTIIFLIRSRRIRKRSNVPIPSQRVILLIYLIKRSRRRIHSPSYSYFRIIIIINAVHAADYPGLAIRIRQIAPKLNLPNTLFRIILILCKIDKH